MNISDELLSEGIHRIRLAGRMDMAGTQQIEIKLSGMTASPRKAVVIDLEEVTFLASIGIRSLLMAAKGVHGRGGKIVLVGASPMIRKVLETAGLDTLIPLFDDVAAAQAAVVSS